MAAAGDEDGLAETGAVAPALSALLASLDTEADLHPLGRCMMWHHVVQLLATRRRLERCWRDHDLDRARIARPLFITGMPRSGSTFLHELLAADPGNRAPRAWEIMSPVPPATGRDDRVRRTAVQLWWFRRIAPAADAAHPLRATSPHECEAIHSYTFLSHEFLATCWLPRYEAFLRACDPAPAYAFQKKFLQYLQGPAATPHWVLKSPDHAHALAQLFAVFPDALVVQTHRPPADVLASCLHLVEVLHRVFARARGRTQRARREARVLVESVEQMIRFREAHPGRADQFIDVSYAALVADPLAVVKRIYRRWGRVLTPAAAAAMGALARGRSRYPKAHAAPRSDRSIPGLDVELRRLDGYCMRFGLQARSS
jgi:LPS sulfotransferase NodH